LNIFQGGFLGLDNIEIFDRSAPLPTGGMIDQVDGTAWVASFALHLMRMSLELAKENPEYQDIAIKFFEHFMLIAQAMSAAGDDGLWDEQEGFFYDLLRLPDGSAVKLRVRSIVGLTPLLAVQVLEPDLITRLPVFFTKLDRFLQSRPDIAKLISFWTIPGEGERRLLALLRGHRTKALLARMLDETEFLSPHGIRAVSKFHQQNPYIFEYGGQRFGVRYTPGESDSGAFGGNSNWRGPVWMPVNYLLIEALYEFQRYYSDDFVVEYPRGSGKMLSLREVAFMLGRRLAGLSMLDDAGSRPVMAAYPQLAADPAARDLVLFHEYYHGDTGRGAGASHQTGWSAAVALLLSASLPG
jgi:hypothetical protein